MPILIYIFSGILGGVLSGLLGIGGGIVMVPIFYYGLKMNLHTAIGSSLAIIVPTALIGSITHYLNGHVDMKLAGIVAVFAIIGGFFGARLSGCTDVNILRKVFAVIMLIVAVKMFFQG